MAQQLPPRFVTPPRQLLAWYLLDLTCLVLAACCCWRRASKAGSGTERKHLGQEQHTSHSPSSCYSNNKPLIQAISAQACSLLPHILPPPSTLLPSVSPHRRNPPFLPSVNYRRLSLLPPHSRFFALPPNELLLPSSPFTPRLLLLLLLASPDTVGRILQVTPASKQAIKK